jgi:hypothetical protein
VRGRAERATVDRLPALSRRYAVTEVREAIVERLLKGFRENDSGAALGSFAGVEFQKDPPTEEERAEAERRYVDELAKRGRSELGESEDAPDA